MLGIGWGYYINLSTKVDEGSGNFFVSLLALGIDVEIAKTKTSFLSLDIY